MVCEPARGCPLVVLQAVRVEDRDLYSFEGPVDRTAGQVQLLGDLFHRAPAGAGGEDSLRVLVDVRDVGHAQDGFSFCWCDLLNWHPRCPRVARPGVMPLRQCRAMERLVSMRIV